MFDMIAAFSQAADIFVQHNGSCVGRCLGCCCNSGPFLPAFRLPLRPFPALLGLVKSDLWFFPLKAAAWHG